MAEKRIGIIITCVLAAIVLSKPASGVMRSVPYVYDTIQEAIDSAEDGDEVVVDDGTYYGSGNIELDFGGKAITVRSRWGDPSTCIIDCRRAGRAFVFHNDEGPDSIVKGFTIRGGCLEGSNYGGGVYIDGSPTFIDCVITDNEVFMAAGCGVACIGGAPTFIDCKINENTGDRCDGGGVYSLLGHPIFIRCEICDNTASSGGAFSAGWYGGSLNLINCTVSGNTSIIAGGGIDCGNYASINMANCIISGNHAGNVGGGLYIGFDGGGMLNNCTISGNSAPEGGGIYSGDYAPPMVLSNCILWGNTSQEICDPSLSMTLSHCVVGGGWPGVGNIDADPLFFDADGPDDDPSTWADNDFRLTVGSSCIDAGDNAAVPDDAQDLDGDGITVEPLPFDFSYAARFIDDAGMVDIGTGDAPIVDIGAYEFQGETCLGDLDDDGEVGLNDLAELLGNYGLVDGAGYFDGDLNRDGEVGLPDLAALLGVYGDLCQ